LETVTNGLGVVEGGNGVEGEEVIAGGVGKLVGDPLVVPNEGPKALEAADKTKVRVGVPGGAFTFGGVCEEVEVEAVMACGGVRAGGGGGWRWREGRGGRAAGGGRRRG
jgi:hypothetical protein